MFSGKVGMARLIRRMAVPLLLGVAVVAFCQEARVDHRESPSKSSAPPAVGAEPSASGSKPLNEWITQVVLDNIPHDYVDDDQWGQTIRRFNGVRLRREGWRLETKRDWVDVNHGLWQKSSARLIDPNQRFEVALSNLRVVDQERIAVEIGFVAPLALEGRQSQWVNGVQLYSLSVDAEATVRLSISCTVAVDFDVEGLTPVVVLRPVVTAADLKVDSFAVKRVSKLGGEFAQQVTRLIESRLSDRLAAQNQQLVDKLNGQITKHSDKFRIPLR